MPGLRDMAPQPPPEDTIPSRRLADMGNIVAMANIPRVATEVPKMSRKEVFKAINTTLSPFALQELNHVAHETKKEVEDKTNAFLYKITYPEDIIEEVVKKYLLQH